MKKQKLHNGWPTREAYLAYQREYHKRNYVKARKKEYSKEHREEARKNARNYYWRHKEERRELLRQRFYEPKYQFFSLKSSAKRRGLVVEIELDDFIKITKGLCEYCGEINAGFGVDRVDSSIGYLKYNCVSCCSDCNFMKLSKTKQQFLEKVERIYKHNF